MNHQSMPLVSDWLWALTRANRMARKTGRRWRVRQAGHLWYAHEVDQPRHRRKPPESLVLIDPHPNTKKESN